MTPDVLEITLGLRMLCVSFLGSACVTFIAKRQMEIIPVKWSRLKQHYIR